MAYKTSRGSWRVHLRVNGRRVSKNFRTKVRAEAWERRVKDGDPPVLKKEAAPILSDYFSQWVMWVGEVELADSTLGGLKQLFKRHLEPHWGRLPVDAMTRDDALALRVTLKGSLSPAYANKVLNLARHLFKVLFESEVIRRNPWVGVKRLKVSQRQITYWSLAERDTALAYLAETDRAFSELVTVAVHTGLRWGELYALERQHIDLERGLLTVCANYRPSVKRKVNRTKTGRVEVVPMDPVALAVLAKRAGLAPGEPVFDPKLLEAARYRIVKAAKAAHVPVIRFHDLRHTFASNLRECGVDLDTVRQLMRHQSLAMTLIYAHLGRADLSSAVSKLCASSGTHLAPLPPKPVAKAPKLQVVSASSDNGPIVKWTAKMVS